MPEVLAAQTNGKKGSVYLGPVSGVSRTATYLGTLEDDQEPNSLLKGYKWYGSPDFIGVAQKMQRDYAVGKAHRVVKGNVLRGNWVLEPKRVSANIEALAREVAAYVQLVLQDNGDLENVLSLQTNGFRDGFAALEVYFEPYRFDRSLFPSHKGRGLGFKPVFRQRPAWSIKEFYAQSVDDARLDYVTQWTPTGEDNKLDAQQLLRYTHDEEGGYFPGRALWREMYAPWRAKVILSIVELILHERAGAGVPTIALAEQAEKKDRERAISMLQNLRAHKHAYMILPNGYSFNWNDIQSNTGEALREAIRSADVAILNVVGAGYSNLGQGQSSGSHALSKTQQGDLHVISMTAAQSLLRPWNVDTDKGSMLWRIVAANYGSEVADMVCPKFAVYDLPTKDWATAVKEYRESAKEGLIRHTERDESWLRRTNGAPSFDANSPTIILGESDDNDVG